MANMRAGHASGAIDLVTAVRRLAVARTMSEVMEIATHAARALLGADGVTFVLRDGDQCFYADEDAIAPLWKGRRFPLRACISGWCMEHGKSVAIRDIYKDPRIPLDLYRPTFVYSLAMAPVGQDRPVAALGAYWSRRRQASAEDMELLQTVADAAALAISFVELRDARGLGPSRGLAAVREAAAEGLAAFARSFAWVWRAFTPSAADTSAAKRVGVWEALMVGLGFSVMAWVARGVLVPLLGPEVPYAFFSAAVLLASFSSGRLAGLTAAVAGGLAANLTFVGAAREFEFAGRHLWALAAFWGLSLAMIQVAQAMTAAIRREAAANARLELVGDELRHRIRNLITVTQALARQTGRGASDVKEFERKFGQRLQALAEAQGLLAQRDKRAVGMGELIERVLAPFDVEGRVVWEEGPLVELDDQLALSLILVLNELATNATKHGALSTEKGRIALNWSCNEDRVLVTWIEGGGPTVEPTLMSGFGHQLLNAALPRNRGVIRLDFDPKGVQCEIELRLEAVAKKQRAAA